MEYLSKLIKETAVDKLNKEYPDWMLLVELNKMILKYSVGGWKKEDFLRSVEEMDKEKKGKGRSKTHTVGSLKSSLKEVGIKHGLSKYNRNELIRVYLKDKFYKENKDEICILNRGELVHFLDQFKDRLKGIITTIPEGNQGLLKVDDIVNTNHGFHYSEASRELLYLSNPLYTLFTMITENYHTIHQGHRQEVRTMGEEVDDDFINRWSEYVPNYLDDMIQITRRTYDSIKETSLEIMEIILAKLYDIEVLNHRANINPIVNIILLGNYASPIFQRTHTHSINERERFNYSLNLFQLLVNNGLEKVNIGGVYYDIMLGERGGVFYHSVNGKILLSHPPFLDYIPHEQGGPVPVAEFREGGAATYYSICRPHLKDIWKDSIKLHLSQKRLNFVLGTMDTQSPLNLIDERGLIENIGQMKRIRRGQRESMRRQHLIGPVQNKNFLTERRLALGSAITLDKSVIRDIPLEVLGKVLTYLSKKHIPMPEQKISDILEDIHERREFEKVFGSINEDEGEDEQFAIMDKLEQKDEIKDVVHKKKKVRTQKKKKIKKKKEKKEKKKIKKKRK